MSRERIAIVGVGRMGSNMARRLHERGWPVTAVYDVDRPAAERLAAELGCAAPFDLPAVAAAAEIVLTVVPDDAAMHAIFSPLAPSLLANALGRLFINCATITPAVHLEVDAWLHAAGAQALEACMASSISQARAGTLYLMCGGTEQAFTRAEPVLRDLGSTVRHIGPAGQAAQLKALVNMVMNINTAGLAEGLGLAAALGFDLGLVREVFAETGAASRVLQTDGEDMQKRDHACFFSAAHAAKDSGIAAALAREAGLALPMNETARAQFERMIALGLGELDKSGVAELTFPGRGKD